MVFISLYQKNCFIYVIKNDVYYFCLLAYLRLSNMAVCKQMMSLAAVVAKPAEEKPEEQLEEHIYNRAKIPFLVLSKVEEKMFGRDENCVSEKMVRCYITGKKVPGRFALLPTTVSFDESGTTFNVPGIGYRGFSMGYSNTCLAFEVKIIHPSGRVDEIDKDLWIVPRLYDKSMIASPLALFVATQFLATQLPPELVSIIMGYFGANVRYYEQVVGPESFQPKIDARTEYVTINGPPIKEKPFQWGPSYEKLDMAYSLEGLLQLVEQGVMCIGYLDKQTKRPHFKHPKDHTCSICIDNWKIVAHTEDAFHHVFPEIQGCFRYVFPDGCRNSLQSTYDSVTAMETRCAICIDKMKLAVQGMFS